MKEPQRIKLTDSPENKRVNLTPLPSLQDKYLDNMGDDVWIKEKINTTSNQDEIKDKI